MINTRFDVLALAALIFLNGCSPSKKTTVTSGMKMNDAVGAMINRGLAPDQMGYIAAHNAFTLPDGRTIVLFGSQTVDRIEWILNPDRGKGFRKSKILESVSF